MKHIVIDSNMVKSNAHWSLQRQRQTLKDDVSREKSLKDSLSLFALYDMLKLYIRSSIMFAITCRLDFLVVEDQHEYKGLVVGHKLVSKELFSVVCKGFP